MQRTILVLTFIISARVSMAQTPNILISGDNQFSKIADFIPDPKVEGEFRLLEKSVEMNLYLEGTLEPYKVRRANVNLLDQSVLLDQGGSTVYIRPEFVDSATWAQMKLVNSRHLSDDQLHKLLEPVWHGELTRLYKEQRMELLPPTYNESLQIGNKNYTLELDITFYILDKDDSLLEVVKNLKAFKQKSYFGALKKFTKTEKVDFKLADDMLQVAAFIEKYELE